jgi:hypothetical protein
VKEVWKIIEDTYASFGFKTSALKTNLSSKFCTYLGRIWYEGVELTPGAKAFLKIMPDYTAKFRSFQEETSSLYATAQGSIKAGTSWEIAYLKYLREFVMSFLRWSKWRVNKSEQFIGTIAPWFVTPIGLGGFGLASLQHLVSTLEDSAMSMGIGMLCTAAKAYPQRVHIVTKILSQPVRPIGAANLLRNPKKVFRQGPTLDTSLVERIISDYMHEHKMAFGQWFQDIIESASKFNLEAYAAACLTSEDVNIVVLKELYKITPAYVLDKIIGKFKKSETILALLGVSVGSRLYKSALNNFRKVVEANTFIM